MASRRLREFQRWMKSQGVEYSESLNLVDIPEEGISVRALSDLQKGDVVAKIPKSACLTIETSGAREMIASSGLAGHLGLAVAVMYERSLGEDSPWAGYLQVLPRQEDLPIIWSLHEIDTFLCGTELHKVVKEDKDLLNEDWKEHILPLINSPDLKLDVKYFSLDDYIAAKSLVASRSFKIDDYHGYGMVPFADLFNHKTGAEDVHFTSTLSDSESESESESESDAESESEVEDNLDVQESVGNDDHSVQNSTFDKVRGENSDSGDDSNSSPKDDPSVLEMIMVNNVVKGAEVFNTYGLVGNAALFHRYGFTEQSNPYDIVNIDIELVFEWASSKFSDRYARARFALWRQCTSQESEYFEISSDGEPQDAGFSALLYILLLPEDAYHKLDLAISTAGDNDEIDVFSPEIFEKTSGTNWELFLSNAIGEAIHELANLRDGLYGSKSVEDDVEALRSCCIKERKLYHSLVLRISERMILLKLRSFADGHFGSQSARKKLKKS